MELMEIKGLQITMIMSEFSPALDLNNSISTAVWAVLGCRWPDAPWPAEGNKLFSQGSWLPSPQTVPGCCTIRLWG